MRSPRSALTLAAGTLGALVLLYGVGVNVLLSSGGLENLLSSHPDKLHIEIGHARTLWPGRVHVEGLDIRGRDPRIEWSLHIDSADADISLFALLVRRFHVERVTARGVAFRARFRLEMDDATPDRLACIPPIAGFDPVPILNPSDETPGDHKSFTIQLENVEATDVREVWIDSFRLRGQMAVAGGFQLGPGKRLEVTPSRMTTTGDSLTIGDDVIATNLRGGADAVLDPVDLGEVKGVRVFRSLSSHSGFSGEAGGLRFLRHFVDGAPVVLEGGAGTLVGTLIVDHGVVEPPSNSHLELGPASVTIAGRKIQARSTIDLAVREDDAGERGALDLALADVSFSAREGAPPSLTSPAMSLHLGVAGTDFAEAPRDFDYDARAPAIDVSDLAVLEEALPGDGPFHVRGGRADLSVHVSGSKEEARSEVGVRSTMAFTLQGAKASASLGGKVVGHAIFQARTLDLSGTAVEMKGLDAGRSRAKPGWWGEAELTSSMVHLSPPSFTATFTTTARDAVPLLDLYGAMQGTSPILTAVLRILPEPLEEQMTSSLHGSVRIGVSPRLLEVHGLRVAASGTSLEGELTRRGSAKTGGFLFRAGLLSAGVSFEGETTSPVLVDAPGWFARSVSHARAP